MRFLERKRRYARNAMKLTLSLRMNAKNAAISFQRLEE